jgi:hypothetical protein
VALDAPVGRKGVRPTEPLPALALDVEKTAASASPGPLLPAACLFVPAIALTERALPASPLLGAAILIVPVRTLEGRTPAVELA